MDTVSGTEGWYIGQMLDRNILTVAQAVEMVEAVTKEDITKLAKTITLNTIYLLQPKEEENE